MLQYSAQTASGELHGMPMNNGPGSGPGNFSGNNGPGQNRPGNNGNNTVGSGDLGTFLPDGVSEIVAFPMLNSLLVRGTEEGIDKFIEFLKLIDKKPQEILVEIQSVVVSNTLSKAYGLQWFYRVGALTVSPTGYTTASSVSIGYNPPGLTDFNATLTYLLSNSQGKVTDAIRVATMNLMTASNSVTTQYPIVTTSTSVSNGIVPVTSTNVNLTFLPLISSISITPRINGDGTITMTIPFTKTDVTDTVQLPTGVGGTQEIPVQQTTAINTTLNVPDGQTMVLGGYVNNTDQSTEQKTPLLSDLPLVGRLFTRTTRDVVESETLIFVTPHIIKDDAAPETLGGDLAGTVFSKRMGSGARKGAASLLWWV